MLTRDNKGIQFLFKKLSIILLLFGLFFVIIFNPYFHIKVDKLNINVNENYNLVARTYTPKNYQENIPNVIVAHGIGNSKEIMTPLSIEIAKGGMRAVAFDFGGFGESYPLTKELKSIDNLQQNTVKDIQIIIDYITNNSQIFGKGKMGIIGHSMGGTSALNSGKINKEIQSTVVMSMGGFPSLKSPKNLLFAVGAYEQLNPVYKIFDLLDSSIKNDCQIINNICGDFHEGNAIKIFISGSSDHIIAPYDSALTQEIVHWLQGSFDLPITQSKFSINWFIFGQCLLFISLIALHIQQIIKVINSNKNNYFLISRINLSLIIALWGLNYLSLLPNNITIMGLIYFLLLFILTNYIGIAPKHNIFRIVIGLVYLMLFLTTFLISTLIIGFFVIKDYPEYILSLPKFIIQWLFFIPYNYWLHIPIIFFSSYTFQLQISSIFWFLIIVESIKSGIILSLIIYGFTKIVKWIRQPFHLSVNISKKDLSRLGILLVVLSILIYKRLNDGLLSTALSLGSEVIRLFVMMILLPLILSFLIIRNNWLKNQITGK